MILCVGTTPVMQRTFVFPRLELDHVNRASEALDTASGKSINVARVVHTLGESSLVTGFLGGDSGRFIRADLAACGLAHDFVEVRPRTRTCVTIIDQSTGQTTELVEEAKPVIASDWQSLREKILALLPQTNFLVLSGSLPPGGPPDFYAWCVGQARERNIRTIVDAAGEPLERALASRPFLVKPNRSELSKTLGKPLDSDATLRDAIKQLNADWIIITEGKSGALISDGINFWRVKSPQVNAINPIGSGDSLAAGVAAALLRGERMPDAIKLGIACGAANAMTKTAGVVDPKVVEQLLPKITIEAL